MKTWRTLFPQITSFGNLVEAFRAARRGKPLTRERADFEFHLEGNLLHLQEELLAGAYRPGPYRTLSCRLVGVGRNRECVKPGTPSEPLRAMFQEATTCLTQGDVEPLRMLLVRGAEPAGSVREPEGRLDGNRESGRFSLLRG